MEKEINEKGNMAMNRRNMIKSGLAVAGLALLPNAASAFSVPSIDDMQSSKASAPGKRKLGASLEVSNIGLGVQNMSRTYQTTYTNGTYAGK